MTPLAAIVVEVVGATVLPLCFTVVLVVGPSIGLVVVGPSTVVEVDVDVDPDVEIVGPSTVVEVVEDDVVGPSTVVEVVEDDVVGPSTVVEVVEDDVVGPSTVVEDVEDVEVEVEVELVVVDGVPDGPQNWTLETAGMFPAPTLGNPAFEKWPLVRAGYSVVTTALVPPLTMTYEIVSVDCQSPPVEVPFVMCTTSRLASGPAKTYLPPENSNFATSVEPVGQFSLPPCDSVVCTKPATTKTAPTTSMRMPEYHGRSLRNR